jgi:hypothetical protein
MRNRSMSRHAMLYAVIFLCLSIAAAPLMLLALLFFDRHRKVNRRLPRSTYVVSPRNFFDSMALTY